MALKGPVPLWVSWVKQPTLAFPFSCMLSEPYSPYLPPHLHFVPCAWRPFLFLLICTSCPALRAPFLFPSHSHFVPCTFTRFSALTLWVGAPALTQATASQLMRRSLPCHDLLHLPAMVDDLIALCFRAHYFRFALCALCLCFALLALCGHFALRALCFAFSLIFCFLFFFSCPPFGFDAGL